MSDTEDQAQEAEVTSEGEQSQTEGPSEEQSEETTDVDTSNESKVYDVLGRQLTPDELYDEYKKTQSYITKLQQDAADREARAKDEAKAAVQEDELLKGVDPDVREAIIKIVEPAIEERLQRDAMEAQRRERDEAFSKRLGELETKFPGGNGLPKFDRRQVILAMQEEGNEIFDPEVKFRAMHQEEFDDYLIKQALKEKKGGPQTESTTGSTPKKPDTKTPRTWEDAAKSAFSRM